MEGPESALKQHTFAPIFMILLLFFNRPQHAAAVIERLRVIQPPVLYVHCDGPRTDREGEAELVAATRNTLESIDWPCEIHTLFRTQNMGLRAGVREAITWFFTHVERGIILEDDCLPDPTFFRFCEELLEKYANSTNVWHIAGSNLAERYTEHTESSFVWSRFSLVWGWATWRRAWQHMRPDLEGLDEFERNHVIRQFLPDRMVQAYMLDKFRTTQQHRNHSWAYAWFYTILLHDGRCIIPTRNLIQNTGIGDAAATHTTTRDPRAILRARPMLFPLKYPIAHEPDIRLERQFFYHTQKRRWRLWLWTVLRWLDRK
jgi:hypothetical protein